MQFRTLVPAAVLLIAACATPPKRSEAPQRRIKDSASERVAAQQLGAPHALQLESESERWGLDAARERRREEEARRKTQTTPSSGGAKSVDVTSPRSP